MQKFPRRAYAAVFAALAAIIPSTVLLFGRGRPHGPEAWRDLAAGVVVGVLVGLALVLLVRMRRKP